MIFADIIKAILILALIVFAFGFIFGFLFKVGIILLMALGVIYLLKKILFD